MPLKRIYEERKETHLEQPYLPGLEKPLDAPLKPYGWLQWPPPATKYISQKVEMPEHDGIALNDSYLLTGLTQAQVDFIEDNEKQLLHLVNELVSKEDVLVTVETHRREIVSIDTNFSVTF